MQIKNIKAISLTESHVANFFYKKSKIDLVAKK